MSRVGGATSASVPALALPPGQKPFFEFGRDAQFSLAPKPANYIVTGISFSEKHDFKPLTLVHAWPRIPWSFIASLPENMRESLIATHVSVLPESYVQSLLKKVVKIAVPSQLDYTLVTPQSEWAIKAWQAASGLARADPRQSVLRCLEDFLREVKQLDLPYHRQLVLSEFRAASQRWTRRNTSVSPERDENYHQVYIEAYDEEMRNTSGNLNLWPRIRDCGLFIDARERPYRYTLSFSASRGSSRFSEWILKKLDPLLSKAKKIMKGRGTILSLAAHEVSMKKERVTLLRESDGRLRLDPVSGNPIVDKKSVQEIAVQMPSDKAIAGCLSFFGSSTPPDVAVLTSADLVYEDLFDANLDFVDVSLGGVSGTGFIDVKLPKTSYLHIVLPRRGLDLWGSETRLVQISGPDVKAGSAIKSFREMPKKFGERPAEESR